MRAVFPHAAADDLPGLVELPLDSRRFGSQPGLAAAAFWTAGVVLRTAFSLYTSDGGASADQTIGRVIRSWHITSSSAACLLLMVLVEVGARQLIVGARYLNLRNRFGPLPRVGSMPLGAADDY